MSEKNTNNSEETMQEAVEKTAEAVEHVAEAVEEKVEQSVPPLMKLKDENPKVFFGGIAAIVVVLGVVFLSGGDNTSSSYTAKEYSVGGAYTLQPQNALVDTSLKILKIPGQMSAFDRDEDVVCKAPSGTPVTITSFQDAFGKKKLFAQVEIKRAAGDCRQGVKGWTLSVNLK